MGNALADITEDGNKWRDDSIAPPSAIYGMDEDAPTFWVAPIAGPVKPAHAGPASHRHIVPRLPDKATSRAPSSTTTRAPSSSGASIQEHESPIGPSGNGDPLSSPQGTAQRPKFERQGSETFQRMVSGEMSPFTPSASLENAYEKVRNFMGMKADGEDVTAEEVQEILTRESLYAEDLTDYQPDQVVSLLESYNRLHTGGHLRQGRRNVLLSRCKAVAGYDVLLSLPRLQSLWPHFPLMTRFANSWKLIYCPRVHGWSLKTFFRQSQFHPGPTLLLLRDVNGWVFGGFASHPWRAAGGQALHYGAPECFVFSYGPDDGQTPSETLRTHHWAGEDMRFMYADHDGISMGGTDTGYAFWVGKDLLRGVSMPSRVFANTEPLASSEEFVLQSIECWGFSDESAPAEPLSPLSPATGKSSGVQSRVDEINAGPQNPAYKRVSCDASDALRFEAFG